MPGFGPTCRRRRPGVTAALLALSLLVASCSNSVDSGPSESGLAEAGPAGAGPSDARSSDARSSEASSSESAGNDGSTTVGSTAMATESLDPLAAVAANYDCLSAEQQQQNFLQLPVHSGDFAATADAVEFGSGPVGVVLSHQSNGNLCQWVDYATVLADRGYHVIVPAYGLNHYVAYAEAAVAELTKSGSTSIVLIGASMGGTISLATAAAMEQSPAAIVSLSGPADYAELDVSASVATLTAPVLFAVGEFDTGFVSSAKKLHAAARKSEDSTLLVVPSESSHGVDLLGEGTVVSAELDSFLQRSAPAR